MLACRHLRRDDAEQELPGAACMWFSRRHSRRLNDATHRAANLRSLALDRASGRQASGRNCGPKARICGPTPKSLALRPIERQFQVQFLVEHRGFEPRTPCLPGKCSPAELMPRERQILSAGRVGGQTQGKQAIWGCASRDTGRARATCQLSDCRARTWRSVAVVAGSLEGRSPRANPGISAQAALTSTCLCNKALYRDCDGGRVDQGGAGY